MELFYLKNFLYFVYLILFVVFGYLFLTKIQVPVTTKPDYIDTKLPNIKRYDCTIAIIDRNGIEHHYMMDENGEPRFDIKDYTDPVYRDYLSYINR